MQRHPIAADATIDDIVGRLNAPTEYVRRVSERMWECTRQFGMAFVRIGVTGAGRAPNYRIECIKDGQKSLFGVYNGLSHKQVEDLGEAVGFDLDNPNASPGILPQPDRTLRREHWSTRAMRLDEITAVLGNLRERRR